MSIPNTRKFAFLTDLHFGYERRSGHKVPLHDMRAFGAAYEFLRDFKPDYLILGGDILDCGAISHHDRGKPGRTEGMRLLADAEGCNKEIITPLHQLYPKERIYIAGNHERFLDDLIEETPGLEGAISIPELLSLTSAWKFIPHNPLGGALFNLGKLTFIHGDQLSGGEHVAKNAVITYERSVRFGHHHTFQAFTKTSAIDIKLGRTGMAIPCLCTKTPKFMQGRANRWQQGINYGYVFSDGTYRDFVSIILDGKMIAEGKLYRG